MSQKANHFKIGLFVIASATLLVVAIVIFGTGILFKREVVFETYMDGGERTGSGLSGETERG